jgi:hypothetical protein
MTFQIQRSSNPGIRPRGSRNENTIVRQALLPDPLGKNPSDAAIRRYAERIDRALAGLAPKRSAARRRQRSAVLSSPGGRGRVALQGRKTGGSACKEQAKYKRGRAAQHAARPSTGRSGRK